MGLKTKVDLINLKFKVNKSVEFQVEIFSNIRTIFSLQLFLDFSKTNCQNVIKVSKKLNFKLVE